MLVYNHWNLNPKPQVTETELEMLYSTPLACKQPAPSVFDGNQQDLYDRVVTHLFQQGRQARMFDSDPRFFSAQDEMAPLCFYRLDGMKCAVGCLITNDDYMDEMEGKSIVELAELYPNYPSIAALIPHQRFLKQLQVVHDDDTLWSSPVLRDVYNTLRELAKVHNLNVLVLEEQYSAYVARLRYQLMDGTLDPVS